MTEILNLAMPFFGLIALGVLATRFWRAGEEGLAWINIFVIYFALPALIFVVIAATPFEKLVDWPFVTATTGVTVIVFLGVLLASMLVLETPFKRAVLQGSAASYGNVGYMGLPLAIAFFGPEAAVPAALIFCFDCTVQATLTAFLATLAHGKSEDAHWGAVGLRIFKQVFTHPFVVAAILGAVASALQFKLPSAIGTLLEMLMKAAGPAALFALGVTVGMRKFAGVGRDLPLIVIAKTILQPALAYLVIRQIPGLDPMWLHVAVMMAALPTASNAFIFATQYRTFIEGASTSVIVTTAISAITVPAIVYLITTGMIP